MYYLGSHHGFEDDGYIGSSQRLNRAIKKRPADFKRRLLERNFVDDQKLTLQLEARWLLMMRPNELGVRYYNLKRYARGGDTRNGRGHTPEARKKIGDAHRGMPHPWTTEMNRTRIVSEATREKHRQHGKMQDNPKAIVAMNAAWRGQKHSPETIAKMRKPKRPETRERMAEARRLWWAARKATTQTEDRMNGTSAPPRQGTREVNALAP